VPLTFAPVSGRSLTSAMRSWSWLEWSSRCLLAGRLRYSGAIYVECFPTERQECFLLGQRHAFEFWEGVPQQALYDNLKPAVAAILAGIAAGASGIYSFQERLWLRGGSFANPRAGGRKAASKILIGFRSPVVSGPHSALSRSGSAQCRPAYGLLCATKRA